MEGVKKKLETYCTIYKCTSVWNTNDNIWRKMSGLFWIFSGTLDGTLLELYLKTRPFMQDGSLLLKIYLKCNRKRESAEIWTTSICTIQEVLQHVFLVFYIWKFANYTNWIYFDKNQTKCRHNLKDLKKLLWRLENFLSKIGIDNPVLHPIFKSLTRKTCVI